MYHKRTLHLGNIHIPVKLSKVVRREALKHVGYIPSFSELFMHFQEERTLGQNVAVSHV